MKQVKRLSATGTWVASSDLTPIDLPRDGLITEIRLRAAITATLTAAAYDDYARRSIFNSLKIEGDGGRAFLGLSGTQLSTLLSLWNECHMKAPTLCSNGAGIALSSPDVASATFNTVLKIHPGSNPRDQFDMTAVIPARALSMLQAKLSTTVAAAPDAAGTITAATYYWEVAHVLDTKVHPGMMTPVGSTLVYTHTANYSDYSYKIDVPAGAFLRGIIIMVRDDTATVPRRKNDEVAGIRLETPKTGAYVFESNIRELEHSMMSRFGWLGVAGDVGPIGAIADLGPRPQSLQSMAPAGFVYIDLRQFANPLYGLDLRGYQTGDFKLGLTIENYAAGDATAIYFDQLLPVEAGWVGR